MGRYFRGKSLRSLLLMAAFATLFGVLLWPVFQPDDFATQMRGALRWEDGALDPLRMVVSPRDFEGRALGNALGESLGWRTEIVEADASAQALHKLVAGAGDVAVIPAVLPQDLQTECRVMGVAGARHLHLIAPADGGLNSYAHLAGRRIGVGLSGSAEENLFRRLIEAAPLDPPAVIVTGHNLDLEQAFLDGEIDAGILLRGIPSADVTRLISTGYYRLLPVPVGASVAWQLPETRLSVIPAQVYTAPGVNTEAVTPIPTLSVPALMVAGPHVGWKAGHSLATQLQQLAVRGGWDLDAENLTSAMSAGISMPWHDGALAAYREQTSVTRRDLRSWQISAFALAVLASSVLLILFTVRNRRGRGASATLRRLVSRARRIEIEFAEAVDESQREMLREQLQLLDDEAERLWLSGAVNAADVMMLRLGWASELPERSIEELRARARELQDVGTGALSRPEKPKPLVEREPHPPREIPDRVRDVTAEHKETDFTPEADAASANPQPIERTSADEFESGALLNTVRIRRRMEDDDEGSEPGEGQRMREAKQPNRPKKEAGGEGEERPQLRLF